MEVHERLLLFGLYTKCWVEKQLRKIKYAGSFVFYT